MVKEVDHEMNVQKSKENPIECESQELDSMNTTLKEVFKEANDGLKYETPPQNKENIEDDDENDVFYSTKKSLTVEKKSYKLRSTPMRTLQYNGSTPLRETRISSKKKKKFINKTAEKTREDSVFKMDQLVESLPVETNDSKISNECQQNEEIIGNANKDQNLIQTEDQNEEQNDNQYEDQYVIQIEDQIENEVFISGENETQITSTDIPLTGRQSYVIEKKVQKTVQLVSPHKSAKSSVKKRAVNSIRRKGTPIRRSTAGPTARVSTQSIVSRLYSSVKRSDNTYKSMAELLKDFESQPRSCDRRSRSVDHTTSGQRSRSSSVSSLTRPQSPKLQSIFRHRPTPRQTEDIIASQIKKYSFKANPIRKKLFDSKFASGIPRVKSHKEPTKAVELHFMTEKRNELRSVKNSTAEDETENKPKIQFKANPMPAFKCRPVLQTKSESKKTAFSFRPFSFDDRIQQLVAKKRNNSEEQIKKDFTRKSFRF